MKPTYLLAGLILLGTSACKQDKEIKVYRVERTNASPHAETAADPHAEVPGMKPGEAAGDPHAGIPGLDPAAGGDPHAGIPGLDPAAGGDPHAGLTPQQLAMVGEPSGPKISDTPPDGWIKQAATSMRQLSYRVEGDDGASTDVSLVILRGAAGGKLVNVNRWRDQQGLPAVTEETLKDHSETLATPLGEALVVDIEGLLEGGDPKKDGRMLGAIVDRGKDGWFFRMRGNSELTAAQKETFLNWVKSIDPAKENEPTKVELPKKTSPAADPNAPAVGGRLTWTIPAGWKADPAVRNMRDATFIITHADGAKGEIAVSHFPGDVGGDLENVNRWLGQVGLPAVDQAGMEKQVSKVKAGPKTLSFVDLKGAKSRMVTGWTRHGADTWFFKLTGPDALVEAELPTFKTFLESIRFTQPE
jgi:hypothetical protein